MDRPEQLNTCLESLAAQNAMDFEVIIVDNGPSSEVASVASTWDDEGLAVRYITEELRGLTYARRRAWQCAAGEIVAYLDDDAVAAPDWVGTILRTFDEASTSTAMLGGPVHNCSPLDKPWPFTESPGVHGLDLGLESRALEPNEVLWGCNFAFTRRALVDLDAFGERLGHRHGHPGANEDILIQRLIDRGGFTRLYNPAMQIVHDSWRATASNRGLDRLAFYTGVDNQMMLRLLGQNSWSQRSSVIKERLVRLRIQLAAGVRAYRSGDATAVGEARRASMKSAGYIVGAAWPPRRLPDKRP